MNSSSYKEFNAACRKAVTKKTDKQDVFIPNNDSAVLNSLFFDIDEVKNNAFQIKQQIISSLADNCLRFEKIFCENGGIIDWTLHYEDVIISIKKILSENKVDTVQIEKDFLVNEIELESFLKHEEIKIKPTKEVLIFQANQLLIESGSIVISTNSKLFYENILSSKIKICLAPIHCFLQSVNHLDLFLNLYSAYKSNQKLQTFSLMLTPNAKEPGDLFYLILVDNKRTQLLKKQDYSTTLNCIHCDACTKVCPVYTAIGSEPYNSVFAGPLAKVIQPFIDNFETSKHLSFASTLCGACTEICPMSIPLSSLILKNRAVIRNEDGTNNIGEEMKLKRLAKFLSNRKKMNAKAWKKNFNFSWFLSGELRWNRYIPQFEKQSFNKQQISPKRKRNIDNIHK